MLQITKSPFNPCSPCRIKYLDKFDASSETTVTLYLQVDFDLDIAAIKYWYIDGKYHYDDTYSENPTLDIKTAYPFSLTEGFIYFYGQPRKATNMLSLFSTFPALLWGLISLSVLSCYCFLALACYAYSQIEERRIIGKFRLFLKVLGSLTEPDTMIIFHKWSTGTCLGAIHLFSPCQSNFKFIFLSCF